MFSMRVLSSLFALLLVVAGAGCSWLPDHRLDYRKVEPEPVLQLPADMDTSGVQPLFVVPDQELRATFDPDEKYEVPLPPDLNVYQSDRPDEGVEQEQDPEKTRVVLSRDGSGYPMIIMHTSFVWAWEYVGQAVEQTDLNVEDRDRESGVFYLDAPEHYGLEEQANLKLSQTAAGIQITVIDAEEGVLAEKGPSLDMLQALYEKL